MKFFRYIAGSAMAFGCVAAYAQSCQEKIDSGGAYVFSHSVPIGNGMVECYVKARDGTGEPTKATIAFEDEPAPKAAGAAPAGASPSKAAPTGSNCPAGSLTDQQRAALKQWMGRRFTDVPVFLEHWLEAAQDKMAAVSVLKSDKKTNQKNRKKYFNPARADFWELVHADARENGARKLIENAGGWFDVAGRAPKMKINGVVQALDVDHIVGLAVEPARMLDPANLQLVSATENQKTLEEIKREDPFQSPEAAERYMKKQGRCE